MIDVDEFLEHYDKKEMRWGVRRNRSSEGKKPSRKDRRKAEAQKRLVDGQKKAASLLNTAVKDKNVLIKLNGQTIVTGKEFTNYMVSGGILNVKTTSIYAQQTKPGGAYQLK